MSATFSLTEVADKMRLGDEMRNPEVWLARKIRAGQFRARKIGHHWRMTESDIEFALAACAHGPQDRPVAAVPASPVLSLTARSRRRPA